MRRPASRFVVAFLAAADVRELLMMHNVAAMADVERPAFFAARSPRADVTMQTTGA
jgi:hypothetical protein